MPLAAFHTFGSQHLLLLGVFVVGLVGVVVCGRARRPSGAGLDEPGRRKGLDQPGAFDRVFAVVLVVVVRPAPEVAALVVAASYLAAYLESSSLVLPALQRSDKAAQAAAIGVTGVNLAVVAAAPDRAHRVDHELGGQFVGGCRFRVAVGAALQAAAGVEEVGPGGPVDGAVHAAAIRSSPPPSDFCAPRGSGIVRGCQKRCPAPTPIGRLS